MIPAGLGVMARVRQTRRRSRQEQLAFRQGAHLDAAGVLAVRATQRYLNVREMRVLGVTEEAVRVRELGAEGYWWRYGCSRHDPTLLGWRELVRHAQMTQEGLG